MLRTVVTIILISIILITPVACFAHPCGTLAWLSDASSVTAVEELDQCPQHLDVDDCDSTCCCAGYSPARSMQSSDYAPSITRYLVFEQLYMLPQVVIPIDIPPQNFV